MDYPQYERDQELACVGDHVPEYMQAIFDEWGPNYDTLASLSRRLYKDTDAGITISYQFDDGSFSWSRSDIDLADPRLVRNVRRIGFSSIIEDSDAEVPLQWLDLLDERWDTPAKAVAEFNRLAQDTNDEACRIWDDEHAFYFTKDR